MSTNGESTDSETSVVARSWKALRDGFEWFADTFRGHAHVREMENERE